MSEITRLLDQLRRAFDGDVWSGPSLLATLEGLGAAQAAPHPLPTSHSIWEIVRHLTAWSAAVARRLEGDEQLQLSGAADWPPAPEQPTEAAWQATLADLRAAHAHLLRAVEALPDADLDRTVGSTPDRPEGLGWSRYVMLPGVAQHYLYHAGQVALLRKLGACWKWFW